ncbi:hypothetical protein [Alishewanella phage vB_AspM_Slickus01]|nr:hypothetical protein [Alishewanella phage vB_AspM_Slickus01]
MAVISQAISKDLLDMYDGYDATQVGLGVQEPSIYATPSYTKKKIQKMILGGISDISYAGYDLDRQPVVLIMGYEPAYNTVIGLNLRYITPIYRRKILKYVLDSNVARIKSNTPIMINYDSLVRLVPQIKGIIRRYKIIGVRVEKTYQLNEWPEIIKMKSPHSNVYLMR